MKNSITATSHKDNTYASPILLPVLNYLKILITVLNLIPKHTYFASSFRRMLHDVVERSHHVLPNKRASSEMGKAFLNSTPTSVKAVNGTMK